MSWFRLHDEIAHDPKLRLSFPPAERWKWVCLLCLANKQKKRGVLAMPEDEIALDLDLSEEEWAAFLAKLEKRKMVHRDGEKLVVTNWGSRQYDYPSAAPEATAERVARHRAKKRDVTDSNEPGNELSREESRDVTSLTEQNKAAADQNISEQSSTDARYLVPDNPAALSASGTAAAAPAAGFDNGLKIETLTDSELTTQAMIDYPRNDANRDFWAKYDLRRSKATRNPDAYCRQFIIDHYRNSPPLTWARSASPAAGTPIDFWGMRASTHGGRTDRPCPGWPCIDGVTYAVGAPPPAATARDWIEANRRAAPVSVSSVGSPVSRGRGRKYT
ncbi:MAG: hypothetical protein V4671_23180 [Armatimonadota bacterium]